MTVKNYCEKPDLIARLMGEGITPSSTDERTMEQVIEGASRAIEAFCGRRFYVVSETRYYTPEANDELFVDDLTEITTLQTDEDGDRTYETTWATTDYDLLPLNAALESKPYTRIEVTPEGNYWFPQGLAKSVKIVGKFGYADRPPAQVREACLLQCERLWKRKDAPFGVAGSPELGTMRLIPELDPDVKFMLQPLARIV